MRLVNHGIAVLLQASCSLAVFNVMDKPLKYENITAGTTYTLQWIVDPISPTGPVTIILAGGESHPGGLFPIGTPLASMS
jgi:hypothetical protein